MNGAYGRQCPCGTSAIYDACCGPLHRGERQAGTAEELMRSRYAAFARGDANYLFRTWHPRTRPADVTTDEGMVWTGLDVMDTAAGGVDDDSGEVEFTAHFVADGRADSMHARGRFERRAGRWFYTSDA